jgi:chromosome segregation ATPase
VVIGHSSQRVVGVGHSNNGYKQSVDSSVNRVMASSWSVTNVTSGTSPASHSALLEQYVAKIERGRNSHRETVEQLEKDHHEIVEGLKNELDDFVIERNTQNDEAAAVTAKQEEQTKTKSLQSAIEAMNTQTETMVKICDDLTNARNEAAAATVTAQQEQKAHLQSAVETLNTRAETMVKMCDDLVNAWNEAAAATVTAQQGRRANTYVKPQTLLNNYISGAFIIK